MGLHYKINNFIKFNDIKHAKSMMLKTLFGQNLHLPMFKNHM